MKLKELTEEFGVLRKTFQDKAQTGLTNGILEFFAENPEIEYLRWTQYAPYFNDGDPCVFHVYDVHAFLTAQARADFGLDAESEDDVEGHLYEICRWDMREHKYVYASGRAKELEDAVGEFEKALKSLDDFLDTMYGSDTEVRVYRDGHTETEDYSGSHD